MKTAGKWAIYIFGGIAALLVIVGLLFHVFGDYLIKVGVEKGGTYALKVPVEVNSVSLSVFGGSIGINGLKIANPQGFELPEMLTMNNAFAAVQIGSLTTDTVEVESVRIDGVNLVIEQKGLSTNLQQVLNSLPKSKQEAEQAPGKKLKIKTLEISNVSVTMKLLPLPGKASKVTMKLAPIKMENLGSDSPLSMAELAGKVLVAIAAGVAKQGTDLIPPDLRNGIESGLSGTGKFLQQGVKGVFETGKGVGEGILNIFGKKPKDANQSN